MKIGHIGLFAVHMTNYRGKIVLTKECKQWKIKFGYSMKKIGTIECIN